MADADQTTIFIVEDHDMVRNLLAQMIERTPGLALGGVAATGEAALEAIRARRPDLVIVDISLPGMDGIALIRVLHERYPDLQILAASGHDEVLYAAAALEAGAQGYIMKGNSSQILEAIACIRRGERYVSEELRGKIDELG